MPSARLLSFSRPLFPGDLGYCEGKNTKILVVDDDQELALILKAILENEAHEVRLARDGQDGFLAYLFFGADVVITDIQMPERDGLELMRLIRMVDPSISTIYISCDLDRYASLLENERVRHRACRLQKPFSKDELLSLVSQFTSKLGEKKS
jgi:DNA-binding NtrC family response regulator